MLGTIGFDLDMTLVDSRPGIERSMRALAKESGRAIDVDLVLSRLGAKLDTELACWFPAEEVERACERYRELYFDNCLGDGTLALPGAHEALDAVHDRGGRVLVVTAKSEHLAKRCLDHVGLAYDALAGYVWGTEKSQAMRAHDARAYVGDTVTDIASALAAHATAVGVGTGPDSLDDLRGAGAHEVFASLNDVAAWVRALPPLT